MLLYQVADAGRRGYERLLEGFWDEAHSAGVDLPCDAPVSAAAYCQARAKLDPQAVRGVLHRVADAFESAHGEHFRFKGRRLLAVDGTKFLLQRSDDLWSAYGGMSSGYHPIAWVCTLFDVLSKVPLDLDIGPNNGSERRQLSRLLDRTGEDDILVLDRGFQSFDVFVMLVLSKLEFVMRASVGLFAAVKDFLATGADDGFIEFEPPKTAAARDAGPQRLRVVVSRRKGHEPVVLLTTLDAAQFSSDEVRTVYRLRWEVEEYYKLVQAPYFTQGLFHAKSQRGVEQEIFAQALFVAVTRHLMACASKEHTADYREISQKAAVFAVSRTLAQLVLDPDSQRCGALLRRLLDRIAAAKQPVRPGRHFPRRSFLPQRLWGPYGRRRTDPNHRKKRAARLALG
jgi:hypothetical protein